MTFEKQFTEEERATISAAFGIIHDAMIEAGEEVIMLTSELDSSPGAPKELLISHFVRGGTALKLASQGLFTEALLQ
jgi:hypothetical protein